MWFVFLFHNINQSTQSSIHTLYFITYPEILTTRAKHSSWGHNAGSQDITTSIVSALISYHPYYPPSCRNKWPSGHYIHIFWDDGLYLTLRLNSRNNQLVIESPSILFFFDQIISSAKIASVLLASLNLYNQIAVFKWLLQNPSVLFSYWRQRK